MFQQITEGCLPLDELLFVQELNYRISVLETFQNFCKTAPVTTDTRVMSFHYQLVDAYTRFLMNERKFGLKTDENGQKKRETAFSAIRTCHSRHPQTVFKLCSGNTGSVQKKYHSACEYDTACMAAVS